MLHLPVRLFSPAVLVLLICPGIAVDARRLRRPCARRQALSAGPGSLRGIRGRFLLLALSLLWPTQAWAQASPPPAPTTGEIVEYYATDALGSIRVVFTASGAVVGRADYLPFGERFHATGPLPSQQFTGQQRDPEAQLDHFNARSYQTTTGRFTGIDPVYAGLFDPQQWNRYGYARANPLKYVDPDGRQFKSGTTCPGDPTCPVLPGGTEGSVHAGLGGLVFGEYLGSVFLLGVGDGVGDGGGVEVAGGTLLGAGGGIEVAVDFQNRPDIVGNARLGGEDATHRYGWKRTFHIDRDRYTRQVHFNIDYDWAKRLNHLALPEWVHRFGKTSALRTAGRAVLGAGVLLDAYALLTASDKCVAAAVVAGGVAGAMAGGALGSFFPGPGTVLGGAGGGALGSAAGTAIGGWACGS